MASSSSLAVVVALHFTSKDFLKLFGQGAYAGNLGCILWWSTACTCDHIFPSGSGSKHSFLAASKGDPSSGFCGCFPLGLRLRLATLVSSARWVCCWCRLFMDGFWIGTLHTPRRHLTLQLKFCTSRVLGRRGFVGPLKASLVSPVLLELSSPLAAGCSDESRCCRHFAVPSAAFSMALHRMSWDFTWRAWCLHSAQ